jgi:hypothetical protein
MSSWLEQLSRVKSHVWEFFRGVWSANHDYPYHDYFNYTNQGGDPVVVPYIVGSNMVDAHGTQRKLFTAKRTLLWTSEAVSFRLNSPNNVLIPVKWHQFVLEETILRQMELHTNVSSIIFTIPAGGTIYAYFEGVLPDEARFPE